MRKWYRKKNKEMK